ncbi:MAG: toxin-antitoxin system YwqK family antitoxin, partial [Bacteroidia bacterium]
MKHYAFACSCLGCILLFLACGGSKEKETDKKTQDSVIAAEKLAKHLEEKKKNIYLIEPPDTAYTGDYVDKYENGNTKFKGYFRFGKRHGQWLAFYPTGLLWSECFYDKGLRQGANNVYYENGEPRYKGWYKHDLRDSLWTFYNT